MDVRNTEWEIYFPEFQYMTLNTWSKYLNKQRDPVQEHLVVITVVMHMVKYRVGKFYSLLSKYIDNLILAQQYLHDSFTLT